MKHFDYWGHQLFDGQRILYVTDNGTLNEGWAQEVEEILYALTKANSLIELTPTSVKEEAAKYNYIIKY